MEFLRKGRKNTELPFLWLRLIVDTVEPDHALQEDMQLGMALGVLGDLEQWFKEVYGGMRY
jgi:hypothetical protein